MPTGNKLGVGGVPLAGEDLRPKNSVYPRGSYSNKSFKCYEKFVHRRRT
jgi:hypothetical protein